MSDAKKAEMLDWGQTPLLQADRTPLLLDHGYDQTAAQNLDQAAAFRGLRLVEHHPVPYAGRRSIRPHRNDLALPETGHALIDEDAAPLTIRSSPNMG